MREKTVHRPGEKAGDGALEPSPTNAPAGLRADSKAPGFPLNGGRVLAIHQGALGDFLLTLPLLHGLHHHCAVTFLLRTREEHGDLLRDLLRQLPFVEEVCAGKETDLTPFYHDTLWEKAPLPPSFQKADAVIFFGQSSARTVCQRLSRRTFCPVLWIQSFPREENGAGRVGQFLADQFRSLKIPLENVPVRLQAPDHVFPELESRLRSVGIEKDCAPVVLHAGSGGKRKIWPLNQWHGLATWIGAKTSRKVVTILGPADSHLVPFARELEKHGVPSLRGLSLVQALALLNRACAYVGNDSGLSHLAAMAGAPSIVIFGPTDPGVWAPEGENVHIIRTRWDEEHNLNLSPLPVEVTPHMETIQGLLLPLIS